VAVRSRIALSLAVSLLTIYAPLVAWMRLGTNAAFVYFAPDAFYYLQIADQAARTGLQAFDGVHTTTGFHPLWGFLLSAAFTHLPSLATKNAQMLFTLALSTVLVAVGVGLLAFAFTRFIRSAMLAFVTLLPGMYYVFFGWAFPPAGSTWSFINGLETPASIFAFSLFALLLPARDDETPTTSRLIAWSFALALMVVARLDDVFLVAAVVVAVARREPQWTGRAMKASAVGAVPAATVAAYIAYNVAVSGHMFPSSAAVKEGSSLLANLHLMALPFAPFGMMLVGADGWPLLAAKSLHLLFPLAAAAIFLMRRRILSLELLAIYVVVKNVYNLAFVWLWHQGFWYFPLPLLIAGLFIALEIEERVWNTTSVGDSRLGSTRVHLLALGIMAFALLAIPFVSQGGPVGWAVFAAVASLGCIVALWGASQWWLIVALTAWGLFLASADVLNRSAWKYGDQYARFWSERETLRHEFDASPLASPIVEFDDGVVTYGLSIQGMSGFGLAADSDVVAAKQAGRLLDLAYQRGFRNIASLYYVPPLPPDARAGSPADAIVANIPSMETEALDRWRFSIVIRDERSGLLVVRFDPR
jgi:hypothetical protein